MDDPYFLIYIFVSKNFMLLSTVGDVSTLLSLLESIVGKAVFHV